jgi:membrane fusion protein (multidrug efflux system)
LADKRTVRDQHDAQDTGDHPESANREGSNSASEQDSDAAPDDAGKEEKDEDDRSARQRAGDWLKSPRHRLIAFIVAIILVLTLVGVVLWRLEARKWQSTENAYIRGPIARLSPGVSGNVSQVFVVDNQLVRAGQPLAAISVGSYDVALQQAKAEVETARAAVVQAEAALVSAKAQVRHAAATARARDAEAEAATRDYRRYASLS